MHNRLSIRRYSVSTGALYTSCATGMGVVMSKKGGWSPMRYTVR